METSFKETRTKRKITGEKFFLTKRRENALHVLSMTLLRRSRSFFTFFLHPRDELLKENRVKIGRRKKIVFELKNFDERVQRENEISSISYATRRYALRSLTFTRSVSLTHYACSSISLVPRSCHQLFLV